MKKEIFFLIFLFILFSYRASATTILLVNSSRDLDVVVSLSLYYSVPNLGIVLFNDTNKNINWLTYYLSWQIKNLFKNKKIDKIIIVGGPLAISQHFEKLIEKNFVNKQLFKRVWGYSAVGTSTELLFIFRNFINCIILVESIKGDVKNKTLLFKILEFSKTRHCPILFSEKDLSPIVYLLLKLLRPEKIYVYGDFNITTLYNFTKEIIRFHIPNTSYKIKVTVSKILFPKYNFVNLTYNYTTLYEILQLNFSINSYNILKLFEISNKYNVNKNLSNFAFSFKFKIYNFSVNSKNHIIKCIITNASNRSYILRYIKLEKNNKILKVLSENKHIIIFITSNSKNILLLAPNNINIICKEINNQINNSLKIIEVKIYYSIYCPHCRELLNYLNSILMNKSLSTLKLCSIENASCRTEMFKICSNLKFCGTPLTVIKYQNGSKIENLTLIGFVKSVEVCKSLGISLKDTVFGKICYDRDINILTGEVIKNIIKMCERNDEI